MTGYGVLIVNSISSNNWGTNELVLARSPRPQFPFSFCPLLIANSSSISFLKYLTCEVKFLIKILPTCNADVKASKTKQNKQKPKRLPKAILAGGNVLSCKVAVLLPLQEVVVTWDSTMLSTGTEIYWRLRLTSWCLSFSGSPMSPFGTNNQKI